MVEYARKSTGGAVMNGERIILNIHAPDRIFEIPVPESRIKNWDEKHGYGSLASIYTLLLSGAYELKAIGKIYGFSRQNVQQIYTDHLRPHVPDTWRERRRVYERTRIRTHRPFPRKTRVILREARHHGIKVEYVNHDHKDKSFGTSVVELLLNGHLVRVHEATKEHQSVKMAYISITPTSIAKYAFHCVVIRVPQYQESVFIIPSTRLSLQQEKTEAQRPRKKPARDIYLPLDDSEKKWSEYRDAWHLLTQAVA